MNLDVYDTTNTAHLGTLTEVHAIGFLDELTIPGYARFQVDAASTADLALLQDRRIVRFRTGATPGDGDVFACIVGDQPADLVSEIEPAPGQTITVVTYECPGLLAWLGYRQGGATLWPHGGLAGRQQNPRLFGPFGPDFDDSQFASPDVGGALSTEGWPDPAAAAFTFVNNAIFRRALPASAETAGPARMYLVATWQTAATVYLDGDVVLEKPAGKTGLFFADVPYEDIDHQIAIHVEGGSRVGWTWMKLEETVDADGNETFTLGSVLRRTFDPADFPGAVEPWVAIPNFAAMPGVDVGWVMDVALSEAHDRGDLTQLSWDFTGGPGGQASGGQNWTVEFARGFRLQELGLLLDELCSIEGEPHMTPDGTLQIFQERGTDRTGTVTIVAPFELGLTGRGPQATRWLYETAGGLGQVINTAAEAALGVRMERFVQLGTDIHPDGIGASLVRQLEVEGSRRDEVEVDLPDGLTPYVDVFLGDRVSCAGRDGTVAVRLTSFELSVDDDTGFESWTATAVPV